MKALHNGLVRAALVGAALSSPLIATSPSRAANCPTSSSLTYTVVSASGFSCTLGEFTFKNFIFSTTNLPGGNTGFTLGTFQWANFPANYHSLQIQGLQFSGTTASGTYKYDIDTGTTKLESFSTGSTVLGGSSPTVTKTLSDGTNTVTSTNGASSGTYTYTTPAAGTYTFTSVITPSDKVITGTNDIYTHLPADSVPGPLPIVGAGIAFNFSRKLRMRMSSSIC